MNFVGLYKSGTVNMSAKSYAEVQRVFDLICKLVSHTDDVCISTVCCCRGIPCCCRPTFEPVEWNRDAIDIKKRRKQLQSAGSTKKRCRKAKC